MNIQLPRPAHAHDLEAAREAAFALLARGAVDRRSPIHTPNLATIGADGAPRLRTLVLRSFDPASRSLRLHTDRRSEKASEIIADPRVSLHGYDPEQRIQLRLQCLASLHCDDAVAEAGWNASRDFSRMCYAITPGPGHPAAAPPPAPTDAVSGRENFAVIQLIFNEMEWLWLAADGHRRARFTWGQQPIATWLVP
ncbi:pyridoxamine 5'-phosphate oxidase family protein [Rhodovarius sp.]|uniref:pyridoxamine 5'-phosphate oxidase family protein n=1 Tax=Rhodovarius sp. TaxID=2972673 RepID=UPI0033406378